MTHSKLLSQYPNRFRIILEEDRAMGEIFVVLNNQVNRCDFFVFVTRPGQTYI